MNRNRHSRFLRYSMFSEAFIPHLTHDLMIEEKKIKRWTWPLRVTYIQIAMRASHGQATSSSPGRSLLRRCLVLSIMPHGSLVNAILREMKADLFVISANNDPIATAERKIRSGDYEGLGMHLMVVPMHFG